MDAFAVAVEGALSGLFGPFDVSPQTLTLTSNPLTNVVIPNLSFSTTEVLSATIKYAITQTSSTNNAYEAGTLTIVYNPQGPATNKWEVARQFVGNGDVSFTVTDAGQVQLSTTALGGINYVGSISYSATALLIMET